MAYIPGVVEVGRAAAPLLGAGDVLRPQEHGHTEDTIALLQEDRGGHGGIHASTHGDQYSFGSWILDLGSVHEHSDSRKGVLREVSRV
jgi:hypothetical protein